MWLPDPSMRGWLLGTLWSPSWLSILPPGITLWGLSSSLGLPFSSKTPKPSVVLQSDHFQPWAFYSGAYLLAHLQSPSFISCPFPLRRLQPHLWGWSFFGDPCHQQWFSPPSGLLLIFGQWLQSNSEDLEMVCLLPRSLCCFFSPPFVYGLVWRSWRAEQVNPWAGKGGSHPLDISQPAGGWGGPSLKRPTAW